jgi:hypothetical protein
MPLRETFQKITGGWGVEIGCKGDRRTATVDDAGGGTLWREEEGSSLSHFLFAWTSWIRVYKSAQADSHHHTYILLGETHCLHVHTENTYTHVTAARVQTSGFA